MLSDDIIDSRTPALKQLLDVYEKYDAPVVDVFEVPGDAISRLALVDGEEVEPGVYRIKDMVEKPKPEDAPSTWQSSGATFDAGHLCGD